MDWQKIERLEKQLEETEQGNRELIECCRILNQHLKKQIEENGRLQNELSELRRQQMAGATAMKRQEAKEGD